MEFDFSAALLARQVGQANAFGQGDGQCLAHQWNQCSHAIFDIRLDITTGLQGFTQRCELRFTCRRAGLPAAPVREVCMFQRIVQHVAETAAAEAWVEDLGHDILCRTLDSRQQRLVIRAAFFHHRGTCCFRTTVGLGQLGEAVHPPVAWHAARDDARGRHDAFAHGR